MLREFPEVRQEDRAGHRRWFQDEGMELIVWFDAANTVEGFQICYPGAAQREHALTWRVPGGFTHHRVDTGDTRPEKNMTPILVADGEVPWARLGREFDERSAALEPGLRDFILLRL